MNKHIQWYRIGGNVKPSVEAHGPSIVIFNPSHMLDEEYVGHPYQICHPQYVLSGTALANGYTHWSPLEDPPINDFNTGYKTFVSTQVGAHSCKNFRFESDRFPKKEGNWFRFYDCANMNGLLMQYVCVNMNLENFLEWKNLNPGVDRISITLFCNHFAYIDDERIPKSWLQMPNFEGSGTVRSYFPFSGYDEATYAIRLYHRKHISKET